MGKSTRGRRLWAISMPTTPLPQVFMPQAMWLRIRSLRPLPSTKQPPIGILVELQSSIILPEMLRQPLRTLVSSEIRVTAPSTNRREISLRYRLTPTTAPSRQAPLSPIPSSLDPVTTLPLMISKPPSPTPTTTIRRK